MKGVSAVGMFVSLSSSVEARVKLGQLSDTFIEDPKARFLAGQYVSGRILSIQGDRSASDCQPMHHISALNCALHCMPVFTCALLKINDNDDVM